MSVVMRGTMVAGLFVVTLAALAWALTLGGRAEIGALDRGGPLAIWTLPAMKLAFNLAGAGTVGALVLTVYALSPGEPAYRRALHFAGTAAAVWTTTSLALGLTNFQYIANVPLFSPGFVPEFLSFLSSGIAGRTTLVTTVLTAAVCALCFTSRTLRMVAITVFLGFASLVPLVLNSHAASGADHADSTGSIVLHVWAAAVWIGGLATLCRLRPHLNDERFVTVLRRYSTLALVSFGVLTVSGLLAAWAGIGSLNQLGTPYGAILLIKSAGLIVLGVFGMTQRYWIIRRLNIHPHQGTRYFSLLVVMELTIMGVASGLAAALGRTSTPISTGIDTVDPVLPPPTIGSLVSRWELDPLWSVLCAIGAFTYVVGVSRLHRRGEPWPLHRTVCWVLGLVVLFMVTNGGVHLYQGYLFSAHVLTQMLLTAIVPLLLVPAAPLTLASRAIRPRTDGSTGGLEILRATVSPALTAFATPYASVLILAGTLMAFYYTPLLEFSASSQLGFAAMTLTALFSGCLFITAMTTGSRMNVPPTRVSRLTALLGAAALYVIYGRALSAQAESLELPWYRAIGRPWGPDPVAAPHLAGPVLIIIAGISLTIILIVVCRPIIASHQIFMSGSNNSAELSVPGQAS